MIFFQSHVGLCHFPTKHGAMHKALEKRPDMIKRTVDLCCKNDIRVCGCYSLIYNTREHDKRADWRMIGPNGERIPFEYADGYTVFRTRTLHIFDMYQILFD